MKLRLLVIACLLGNCTGCVLTEDDSKANAPLQSETNIDIKITETMLDTDSSINEGSVDVVANPEQGVKGDDSVNDNAENSMPSPELEADSSFAHNHKVHELEQNVPLPLHESKPSNQVPEQSVLSTQTVIKESNWCSQRKATEYFAASEEGWFGFVLKKGTLSGNIDRLVASFYVDSNGLLNKVGRHLVPGDTCLTGPSVDYIVQKIIEPYFVGNVPIVFTTFKNDFYGLFYKDDVEFIRYRQGVGK